MKPLVLAIEAAVFLMVLAGMSTPSRAGAEKHPTVAAVVAHVEEALEDDDAKRIRAALEETVEAHGVAEKARERRRLLKAIGRIVRHEDTELAVAALDAYGRIGNADAWRHYDHLLRRPIDERLSRRQAKALEITRVLTPDGAVRSLLRIVEKSDDLTAAERALEVLGAYGASRHRARILDEIIATVRKERPGVRGRENPTFLGPRHSGEEARTRWQALAPALVRAACELTGHDLRTAGAWLDFHRKNRRKPHVLFPD